MISKLFVLPYFGDLPPWMDLWHANVAELAAHGYDVLLDHDEDSFRQRVRDRLGVECPPMSGTGKTWDYRPALGVLYDNEIASYDFWGHTDLDCVYGRVERWVTDEFLAGIDMHSNCVAYMNGCWSLYRNTATVDNAFTEVRGWQEYLTTPEPTGWGETVYSEQLSEMHSEGRLRKAWTQWQVFDPHELACLRRLPDRRLISDGVEVMMCHFRRTKTYPQGCIL